ncbi:MAG: hypothetical protein GXX84_15725 [Acidobacteria bacterium]|nr:hypothetical protein [Acidobacteriota bacterium]
MPTIKTFLAILSLVLPVAVGGAETSTKMDPRPYLSELSRLGARKPFLTDSPDVYLEPASLNRFFTEPIYRKLQGNAYFGYCYDDGFVFTGREVQIQVLKDITSGARYSAAYRVALEKALTATGLQIKAAAPVQIGVCIVGVEERETATTLPGIMVEAYLRYAPQKKSFFIRFGAGSPRGLPSSLRLSAELLVSELHSRTR